METGIYVFIMLHTLPPNIASHVLYNLREVVKFTVLIEKKLMSLPASIFLNQSFPIGSKELDLFFCIV